MLFRISTADWSYIRDGRQGSQPILKKSAPLWVHGGDDRRLVLIHCISMERLSWQEMRVREVGSWKMEDVEMLERMICCRMIWTNVKVCLVLGGPGSPSSKVVYFNHLQTSRFPRSTREIINNRRIVIIIRDECKEQHKKWGRTTTLCNRRECEADEM